MSLSGCLPNLVMWIPRIQTSSLRHRQLASTSARSRSRWPRCRLRRCRSSTVVSRTFMPSVHVLGVGLDVDHVAPHAACRRSRRPRPRTAPGCPGRRSDTIVNARTSPSVATGTCANVGARSTRRRRCGGRRTGPRTPCTRGPPGAGRRPAPGSRPTGSARSPRPPSRPPTGSVWPPAMEHAESDGEDGGRRAAGREAMGSVCSRTRQSVPHAEPMPHPPVVGTDCLGSRAVGARLGRRHAPGRWRSCGRGNGFRLIEDEVTVPSVEPMTSTSRRWNLLPRPPAEFSWHLAPWRGRGRPPRSWPPGPPRPAPRTRPACAPPAPGRRAARPGPTSTTT